jgi:hypothetical protein
VFFESTRAEKLSRIAELGCDWFIDDLAEVFSDPAFPPGVRRILFGQTNPSLRDCFACATWREIEERIFE